MFKLSSSVVLTLLFTSNILASDKYTTIVENVEKKLAPGNMETLYEFTNHRLDKTTTFYQVRFLIQDTNHIRGYFLQPASDKGREILRVKEDLWTFVPSVGKSVRIADRDSFAGGDFSNADILRVDWTAKYNVSLAKETPNQWIFELKAKGTDAAYNKMRLWVDKKSEQPVQQNFYDANGTLLKKCLYGNVKDFGEVIRPSQLEMENVITKLKSELKIIEFKKNVDIPQAKFSVENLGK